VAISPEFADHLRDLFGALGPVETRRMFGGAGVYLGDAMIALVIDDTLYLTLPTGFLGYVKRAGFQTDPLPQISAHDPKGTYDTEMLFSRNARSMVSSRQHDPLCPRYSQFPVQPCEPSPRPPAATLPGRQRIPGSLHSWR